MESRGESNLFISQLRKSRVFNLKWTQDGALSSSCEILISGELSVCDKLKKKNHVLTMSMNRINSLLSLGD